MGDIVESQKIVFLGKMRNAAQQAINLRTTLAALNNEYFSKKFNQGAENVIVDADLVGTQWEGLDASGGEDDQIVAMFVSCVGYEAWAAAGNAINFSALTE